MGKKIIIQKQSELKLNRLQAYAKERPIFSFEYLDTHFLRKSKAEDGFYREFILRLSKLGQLGWNGIRQSGRHEYGRESISVAQMKPQMPSAITPDITELDVFRANGNNNVFAGFMRDDIFFVVFIEGKFGELYDH